MIILRYSPLNVSLITQCTDTLFVYEETLTRDSYLSKLKNCFGVPVKYNKHNGYSSQFRDNPVEFEILRSSLNDLECKLTLFNKLAFPTTRFGTDISNWDKTCPKLLEYFESEVNRRFHLINN